MSILRIIFFSKPDDKRMRNAKLTGLDLVREITQTSLLLPAKSDKKVMFYYNMVYAWCIQAIFHMP